MLPYGRQSIDDDDIAAVTQALRADFLTTGPTVEAFETAFAQTVGAQHAVACSNGTAALHLAMLALDVQPGEVVIAPSVTFLATANCARFVGAEVVFADVDPASGLMTPATLEEALTRLDGRRLRAVLPVHLRGDTAELPALEALAKSADAVLVEDAPHALGSSLKFGNTVERVGDCAHSAMATFSFHPVKTIATGEGGMVTTNDARIAERLRRLRSHGMIRPEGGDPWWYEMPEIGFNYRLPDILCALGLSQLAKLDRFAARRRALAARYEEALKPLAPLVVQAARPDWSDPVLHLMVALIDFPAAGLTRREVVEALRARGVGTQVHYIPVHTQPYYRERYGELELPGAQAWYERCLSLPLYPGMADEDVDHVVMALAEVLGR
ncbi:UDP-4-amino-4,6-dideoxy-N-acetyl-beta-L-altrosamine transaminase [Phenylobacterium sp. Root77]|jgi:UDP-4-amino-4,6-dideoxy-N-acetyl-beta-L-altrosamine transaminase|uniref:UDP-4-amino-4, 6-dideoxy-N-acetyl-beta-L-altrosamine transaminase n=1 Tax=unclassified Phenylobacterium TaxID=2640670 RepID=UPI0006FA378B|nr:MULTISPECIES: UDP-4-amino-4,6-dideoxy-N-acetyl-beta-L-altrosamine transaminase [unclassified Phenylobacterium]KQW69041.1 UDP-4-amino-4,6-dideoxy-N-acetyl-beta-L-altrosamine transaminase [Phenylobacterium sp. Root1277]KQW95592.1 UDP-4-amino-4,6-dideoxy-N-acetyl-beta-L-altrosamine transaminase [Phenylobacterium sp. Root1290]KRC41381.1 UDP-4-amino-4,6-dideoxy-N-acetyl-beta-L-altrosamine transaminase [Phenylobacterium sp. Root77]